MLRYSHHKWNILIINYFVYISSISVLFLLMSSIGKKGYEYYILNFEITQGLLNKNY